MESKVDTEQNIVTCQVDHFTEFALSGDTELSATPIEESNHIYLPLVVR